MSVSAKKFVYLVLNLKWQNLSVVYLSVFFSHYLLGLCQNMVFLSICLFVCSPFSFPFLTLSLVLSLFRYDQRQIKYIHLISLWMATYLFHTLSLSFSLFLCLSVCLYVSPSRCLSEFYGIDH